MKLRIVHGFRMGKLRYWVERKYLGLFWFHTTIPGEYPSFSELRDAKRAISKYGNKKQETLNNTVVHEEEIIL